jgi:hypothetical protein
LTGEAPPRDAVAHRLPGRPHGRSTIALPRSSARKAGCMTHRG